MICSKCSREFGKIGKSDDKGVNHDLKQCTCVCGKILCFDCNKEEKHILWGMAAPYGDPGTYDSAAIKCCYDEALTFGERGYMVYRIAMKDPWGASVVIKDPEYDSMKRELADLRNEVAELREANRRLQNEIDYRPGGNGYEGAKSHFEDMIKDG